MRSYSRRPSSYLMSTHTLVTSVGDALRSLLSCLTCFPFPACDALSQSEIVVPLLNKAGKVVGVLDLDSTVKGSFDERDKAGLERIVGALRI